MWAWPPELWTQVPHNRRSRVCSDDTPCCQSAAGETPGRCGPSRRCRCWCCPALAQCSETRRQCAGPLGHSVGVGASTARQKLLPWWKPRPHSQRTSTWTRVFFQSHRWGLSLVPLSPRPRQGNRRQEDERVNQQRNLWLSWSRLISTACGGMKKSFCQGYSLENMRDRRVKHLLENTQNSNISPWKYGCKKSSSCKLVPQVEFLVSWLLDQSHIKTSCYYYFCFINVQYSTETFPSYISTPGSHHRGTHSFYSTISQSLMSLIFLYHRLDTPRSHNTCRCSTRTRLLGSSEPRNPKNDVWCVADQKLKHSSKNGQIVIYFVPVWSFKSWPFTLLSLSLVFPLLGGYLVGDSCSVEAVSEESAKWSSDVSKDKNKTFSTFFNIRFGINTKSSDSLCLSFWTDFSLTVTLVKRKPKKKYFLLEHRGFCTVCRRSMIYVYVYMYILYVCTYIYLLRLLFQCGSLVFQSAAVFLLCFINLLERSHTHRWNNGVNTLADSQHQLHGFAPTHSSVSVVQTRQRTCRGGWNTEEERKASLVKIGIYSCTMALYNMGLYSQYQL